MKISQWCFTIADILRDRQAEKISTEEQWEKIVAANTALVYQCEQTSLELE